MKNANPLAVAPLTFNSAVPVIVTLVPSSETKESTNNPLAFALSTLLEVGEAFNLANSFSELNAPPCQASVAESQINEPLAVVPSTSVTNKPASPAPLA